MSLKRLSNLRPMGRTLSRYRNRHLNLHRIHHRLLAVVQGLATAMGWGSEKVKDWVTAMGWGWG